MRARIRILLSVIAIFGIIEAAVAQDLLPRDNGIYSYHKAPRYRESESHPVRVLAYVVHPVGWTLREAIFRPFSALAASTTFTRSFMGFREPFDYREAECFSSSDSIPDCQQVPPYINVGRTGLGEGDDEGEGDDASLAGERQVFLPDVNFDFDKSTLNDLGKGRVRQLSQLLSTVPSLKVVVEGHTDFIGSDEYNVSLGEKRAQAVVDELVALGIDPARLSSISYGESKPIFTEEEDWARAVNRRAQFSVQGQVEEMAAAQPTGE